MVIYKQIDDEIEEKIIIKYGQWIKDWNIIHRSDGCYSLAAIDNNEPIGFISVYPLYYPAPLQEYCDAYIDDIEVDENYRRQGIATELINMTESWARDFGYRQIRAWSSDDKTEALSMWHKLEYGICPAIMRGECPDEKNKDNLFYGFYVSKVFR